MFSVADRTSLREELLGRARGDARVVAAGLLGSAARGEEDEWSDIDLALRLSPDADREAVLADWSEWIEERAEVADRMDLHAAGAVYRVFLCRDSLQLDLSFYPWECFRATNGEPMRLVFGESGTADGPPESRWPSQCRLGWLHALHARSAIARGRSLQADLMLADWRGSIIALACERHGLNPSQGRAAHRLPDDLQAGLARARPPTLASADLTAAFARTAVLYLAEVGARDPTAAEPLRPVLETMVRGLG